MKQIVGWLFLLCVIVGCGEPDQGPPLGPFAAITKTETDAPFNIVPPTSKSPAAFSYTSSKPEVATIAGSLVTIKGPGQTTITASQGGTGGYGPTSASTTLTVTAVACDNGGTRVNGVCTVAPTTDAKQITDNNALTWMGVSRSDTWANAHDFCASATTGGLTGWRQPTVAELKGLKTSGLIPGNNWALGPTWSSDMATTLNVPGHMVVDLSTGAATDRADTAGAYVSCVR